MIEDSLNQDEISIVSHFFTSSIVSRYSTRNSIPRYVFHLNPLSLPQPN